MSAVVGASVQQSLVTAVVGRRIELGRQPLLAVVSAASRWLAVVA